MKMRPLHDTDLARIAPLPRDLKRKALAQIRHGRPPFSYRPLAACYDDIFNVQFAMFGPVNPTEWSIIDERLKRKCKSEDELKSNRLVARGLHTTACAAGWLGRKEDFYPLAMGGGHKAAYWLPVMLAVNGHGVVPYIDPRRSRGLTHAGRRFAFSMMHERIRVADPDYADVRFAIIQFDDVMDELRKPIIHMDDGVALFSLDELEQMVAETYEIWRDVCEEREAEVRRTGTTGSLI